MPDGRQRQGLRDVKKQSWGSSSPMGEADPTHGRRREKGEEGTRAETAHKPISFSSSTMSTEEDAKWLQWVTHQFETIAGKDGEINLQEFKAALNVKEASVHSGSGPCIQNGGAVWLSGTQCLTKRQRSLPGHPQGFRPHPQAGSERFRLCS